MSFSPEHVDLDAAVALRTEPRLAGDVFTHLAQLQGIAEVNGGNRATGTLGFEASLDYAEAVLAAAGFATRRESLDAPHPEADEATIEVVGEESLTVSSVVAMVGTPEADGVTAPLVTSETGCSPAHYADAEGSIVLVRRGGYAFAHKAQLAAQGGALALLVQNQVGEGELFGDLVGRGDVVPTVGLSHADGAVLRDAAIDDEVVLRLTAGAGHRAARVTNLIADWPGGRSNGLVVLGAHLDSVSEGPGIHDNASGVGVVLTLAERLARSGEADGLRVALWDGEEKGLLGSSTHVAALSEAERAGIKGYLSFDMVASRDGQLGLYGDGAPLAVLKDALAGSATLTIDLPGTSDHAPFAAAGIPAAGVHTGTTVPLGMTDDVFGDSTAPPPDACNHLACDTLDIRTDLTSIDAVTITRNPT